MANEECAICQKEFTHRRTPRGRCVMEYKAVQGMSDGLVNFKLCHKCCRRLLKKLK